MLEIVNLSLEGPKLIQAKVIPDERGFFWECYRKSLYQQSGIELDFVQDNHSYSKKNVLRGMHFQRSPGQAKLVSVLTGKILDVLVDLRPGSPTFGKWDSVILEGKEGKQLLVPIGFAHGFLVLSDDAHILYKVTSPYDPFEEKRFRYDDPLIGIQWPIKNPCLSTCDEKAPSFTEALSC